jgi:hypothetical protein
VVFSILSLLKVSSHSESSSSASEEGISQLSSVPLLLECQFSVGIDFDLASLLADLPKYIPFYIRSFRTVRAITAPELASSMKSAIIRSGFSLLSK